MTLQSEWLHGIWSGVTTVRIKVDTVATLLLGSILYGIFSCCSLNGCMLYGVIRVQPKVA